MATKIEDIYADLLLALRADHTYVDLSTQNGTPRVIVDGSAEPPVRPPWLVLGPPQSLSVEVDEAGHRHYRVKWRLEWAGYVAAATDSPYARMLRIAELVSDVVAAVNAAWTTTDGTYAYLHRVVVLTHRVEAIVGGSSGDGLAIAEARGSIEFDYAELDGI